MTPNHSRDFYKDMVMRETLAKALKEALKAKNEVALSTIRLITAALKDRDIAARSAGNTDGISDDDILSMLQTMIKQRQESAKMYRDANRPELADTEDAEIAIIQQFLPEQLGTDAVQSAIAEIIESLEASSVKDMGKVMAELKSRFAGQMDFGMASQMVKTALMAKSAG